MSILSSSFRAKKKKWIKKAGVVSIERESLVVVVVAHPNFGFAGRWGHQKQTDSLIAFSDQSKTYLYLSWKSIKGPAVGAPAALSVLFFSFGFCCQAWKQKCGWVHHVPCRQQICSCRYLFFLGNFLSVSLCLYWAMMIVARLMMK